MTKRVTTGSHLRLVPLGRPSPCAPVRDDAVLGRGESLDREPDGAPHCIVAALTFGLPFVAIIALVMLASGTAIGAIAAFALVGAVAVILTQTARRELASAPARRLAPQPATVRVRDVMHGVEVLANDTDTFGQVVRLMARTHLHELPVVHEGELVGTVSEHDILDRGARARFDSDWWLSPILPAVHAAPATQLDQPLADAIDQMVRAKRATLPVVSNGRVVGVLTEAEVLAAQHA